jgi:hypothetical protein
MHDNGFAGRLDFNQYTREINVFDVLLEVQSSVRYRDKRIIYLGALNSKTAIFAQALQSVRNHRDVSQYDMLFFLYTPTGPGWCRLKTGTTAG